MKFISLINVWEVPLQRPVGQWYQCGVLGCTVHLVACVHLAGGGSSSQGGLRDDMKWGTHTSTILGWGGEVLQSRCLGSFTSLSLLSTLLGPHDDLLHLSFLQLGIMEAGVYLCVLLSITHQ